MKSKPGDHPVSSDSDRQTPSSVVHAFEQLPIAVFSCDKNGKLDYANKRFKALYKKPLETGNADFLQEFTDFNLNRETSENTSSSPLSLSLEKQTSLENRMVVLKAAGQSVFLVSSQLIYDDNNHFSGARFSLVPMPNTQDEGVNHAILSAIVDSSEDAIISKDLEGYITSWNRGAQRIFKYSEEEVIGKHITLLIPENRHSEEDHILKTIRKGERVDHFETIRLDKNAKEIPLSISISPIKNSTGKIIGASKVARDISDRYKSRERQARLSAIVESSDDAIISKDLNGMITSWNQGATRIFGYKESEVLGRHITLLIPEERLQEEDHIIAQIKDGERIQHFETYRSTRAGESIPVSLSISPIKDSAGNIIGASKIARNIQAQKEAEDRIKTYNKKLEILNSIGMDISQNLDVQSVLQKVTDAATKLSGAEFGAFFYNTENEDGESMRLYTLSGAPKEAFEKLGMPRHTEMFKPTFAHHEVVRIADITTDERYAKNAPHLGMPMGHLPVVSYMAVPVISKSGVGIGGLIFGHTQKDVFRLEHEKTVKNIASQAAIALDNSRLFERVKTLNEKKDEFIALASHELKTPLTTVKGYLQVLEKRIAEPMNKLFLEKSLNQVNKLNTLVEELLNMSRIEAGKLEFRYEAFDLRHMLEEISQTFVYSTGQHELITELGQTEVMVKADAPRIEQAVLNLLSNAIKYSPHANSVYLKLIIKDDKAVVSVKDEGIGLTPQQQKKVFSRFYRAESTKGINGLGLGLYLTKQIIDAHKGEIWVESAEGKGSEFSFSLPVFD